MTYFVFVTWEGTLGPFIWQEQVHVSDGWLSCVGPLHSLTVAFQPIIARFVPEDSMSYHKLVVVHAVRECISCLFGKIDRKWVLRKWAIIIISIRCHDACSQRCKTHTQPIHMDACQRIPCVWTAKAWLIYSSNEIRALVRSPKSTGCAYTMLKRDLPNMIKHDSTY